MPTHKNGMIIGNHAIDEIELMILGPSKEQKKAASNTAASPTRGRSRVLP
jgi:hypothetical protein